MLIALEPIGLAEGGGVTNSTFDLAMPLAVPVMVAIVLLTTALVATSKAADLIPYCTQAVGAASTGGAAMSRRLTKALCVMTCPSGLHLTPGAIRAG